MLTLNQIVSQITNLATAHNQIAESGVGDFAEWQAKERSYPILWVFHESTAVSQMEIAFSIRLICADRVIVGEEGDDTQGHEQEVISDTLLVLLDFLAYFQQNHSQPYDVVTSATIDPFTERLNDRLAGNSVTIQIRQPFDWNKCQIPQTGASIPPTVDGLTLYNFCDPSVIARLTDEQVACLQSEYALPATITINSAPFGNAPSGGSLNVPVKNSAGTLRGSKIGADWVVPDGSVPVTNTTATPITTIAVPSGNSVPYVIPNVSWTNSDGSAESTPYGDAIVCDMATGGDVTVTVSDATPATGDTITITATPSGFTANNYLFFTYDGVTIEEIVEQASGVYNWTVERFGTYDIYVLATDGTTSAYGIVEVVATSNFLLDQIASVPELAFALRRLSTGYSGDAAFVRESIGNTGLGIGFIGEDLDTAALIAHVGIGNGFDAILYNQSGVANAVQATAGSQPSMVISGTVQMLNGKPTILFDSSSKILTFSNTSASHMFAVAKADSVAAAIGQYLAGGNNQGVGIGGGSVSGIFMFNTGTLLQTTVKNTTAHQISYRCGAGGTARIRVDGTTEVTGTMPVMTLSTIGNRLDIGFNANSRISEFISFSSNIPDAEELVIEANEKLYWGTP